MSSKQKRVKFNTRERAITADHNLAGDLAARERLEVLRYMYARRRVGSPAESPGLSVDWTDPITDGSVPHVVFGGLLVRPDNAGYLLVDSGSVGYLSPGSNHPDYDSDFMTAASEGVTSTTELVFNANAGGPVRVDIVECRVVDSVLEYAARDIYNESTGQFASELNEKVLGPDLEFRIAEGTTGLRIPDPGWVPLAVVFVQPGAAGFHECDVYDVRPMHQDKIDTVGSGDKPLVLDKCVMAPVGANSLGGYYEADYDGWRVGGAIRATAPSSPSNFGDDDTSNGGNYGVVDFTNTDNVLGGVSAGDETVVIAAVFPGGYPRWVRYSQTPRAGTVSGRLPLGCMGMIYIAPQTATSGAPIWSYVHLEFSKASGWLTHTGLSGTHKGVILGYAHKTSAGDFLLPTGDLHSGFRWSSISWGASGESGVIGEDDAISAESVQPVAVHNFLDADVFGWELSELIAFPMQAASVHVRLQIGAWDSGVTFGWRIFASTDTSVDVNDAILLDELRIPGLDRIYWAGWVPTGRKLTSSPTGVQSAASGVTRGRNNVLAAMYGSGLGRSGTDEKIWITGYRL